MLSSVLRSKRAIQVNIAIMDTFVKLRQMLSTNEDLAKKLKELESRYDKNFKSSNSCRVSWNMKCSGNRSMFLLTALLRLKVSTPYRVVNASLKSTHRQIWGDG